MPEVSLEQQRRDSCPKNEQACGIHPTIISQTSAACENSNAHETRGVKTRKNQKSGEPTPSEADIKITRDLIRAGQLIKIEVLDHIIVGNPNHTSLRSLGYFL